MKIDFKKGDGLVPAIVQDADSNVVLMLGYMNEESYNKTLESGKVTFFSRSRQTLWTKGETSGNFLLLDKLLIDCDDDTILVKARPTGPVCHTGSDTCFDEVNNNKDFLYELEKIVAERKESMPEGSYTTHLFNKGINKIAQKVGEEATEVVIEAIDDNRELLLEESSDLLYHLIVLLQAKGCTLNDISAILRKRHK
jgi:phosphoribosyl-ATP pyrophosphohydrolase/phosphoribosyl-AMP cyclohydrolase